MNDLNLMFAIKKNGYKVKEFCKKVGISYSMFYKKRRMGTFTWKEIKKICEVLNERPEVIFFND